MHFIISMSKRVGVRRIASNVAGAWNSMDIAIICAEERPAG